MGVCSIRVLFYKQTYQKPVVAMSLDTFGNVCRKLIGVGDGDK